jgi:hypothetical protein
LATFETPPVKNALCSSLRESFSTCLFSSCFLVDSTVLLLNKKRQRAGDRNSCSCFYRLIVCLVTWLNFFGEREKWRCCWSVIISSYSASKSEQREKKKKNLSFRMENNIEYKSCQINKINVVLSPSFSKRQRTSFELRERRKKNCLLVFE